MKTIPDGDCKRCMYRNHCMVVCSAAKRRTDQLEAQQETTNRMIKRALLNELIQKERGERYELPVQRVD